MLVFSGTHKALMLSVKTSRVVTSELAERELKQAVGMALGEEASCKANLIPRADLPSTIPESPNKGLYGTKTTRDSGAGEVLNLDAGTVSLRRGFEIKGDLRIVKMELRQWDKTPADPDKRVFVVWYEKLHLGPAEEGKSCTAGSQASDQDGCYFSRCELEYKLNTAKDGAETCRIVGGDCAGVSVASGGGGVDCYIADDNTKMASDGTTYKARTLAGCTSIPESAVYTTAIGFEAGKGTKANTSNNTFIGASAGVRNTQGANNVFLGMGAGGTDSTAGKITGTKNIFLGNKAGKKVTTGANNVFIGYKAGEQVTTGANNIAIGADVASPTDSNQINIGGIIQAKQIGKSSNTDTTKIGTIDLCNAQGTECVRINKNTLTCPTGKYFKGIKQDDNGNWIADCAEDIQCPTSHFFFGPYPSPTVMVSATSARRQPPYTRKDRPKDVQRALLAHLTA